MSPYTCLKKSTHNNLHHVEMNVSQIHPGGEVSVNAAIMLTAAFHGAAVVRGRGEGGGSYQIKLLGRSMIFFSQ